MKTPEEIKKGLTLCSHEAHGEEIICNECPFDYNGSAFLSCTGRLAKDALAYIQQLESSRWELFDDLSTAYYGKQMYGLNEDGTVYSRYSCDTMSFDQAVDEFRRLIADE